MRAASRILLPTVVAFAVIACLAVPTTSHAAWSNVPTLNLPVCTATGSQNTPAIAPDGTGGGYVAWVDQRAGSRVYVQHLLASGLADPAWTANGIAITSLVSQQVNPRVVSDGARGAIVTWEDARTGSYDVYAQHLIAPGIDPAWPVNGRDVCTDPFAQNYHSSVSDGAGGAILAWADYRNSGTTSTDVYAQHVLASGAVDPAWPATGCALVTAAGFQGPTVASIPMPLVSDGAGGAIAAWVDYRAGNSDVYAQHVLANGTVDPLWPTDGRALCTATGDQQIPVGVGDGSGGAYVAWQDLRALSHAYVQHVSAAGGIAVGWPALGLSTNSGVAYQNAPIIVDDGAAGAFLVWGDARTDGSDDYAQHVIPTGLDPAWPAAALAFVTQTGSQFPSSAVPDGAGGAVVFSSDTRSGAYDLYAQHLLANASVDARWPVGGRAVCTALGDQATTPFAISDGAGGLITAWSDPRTGVSDIYAQRVARYGYLGTPEPEIASVKDIPNDQGGKVKLSWYASYLDLNNDANLNYYEIYRSVAPNAAFAALQHGARLMRSVADAPRAGEPAILAPSAATGAYFWELLYTQYVTHFLPTYSYVAATLSDSTGAYNPRTAFMVVGRNYDASSYWMSRPDSGYSVDNLPPVTPAPFTGQYNSGATILHWNPNPETDIANYRLYRGSSPSFVPGPGNLVAAPADTGFTDIAGAPFLYKLSALDIHGNESGFALLTPSGTTDASGAALPRNVALAAPWPNPAFEAAQFTLAMPRAGQVSLAIFDAGGRRVRELVSGSLPAGEHRQIWDLRDDSGRRVAAGLYFSALEADGARITRRFSVVK